MTRQSHFHWGLMQGLSGRAGITVHEQHQVGSSLTSPGWSTFPNILRFSLIQSHWEPEKLGTLGGPGGDVGVSVPGSINDCFSYLTVLKNVTVPLRTDSIYSIVSMGKCSKRQSVWDGWLEGADNCFFTCGDCAEALKKNLVKTE